MTLLADLIERHEKLQITRNNCEAHLKELTEEIQKQCPHKFNHYWNTVIMNQRTYICHTCGMTWQEKRGD